MNIWTLKKDKVSASKLPYGLIAGMNICSECAKYLVNEKHVFYEQENGELVKKIAEATFPIQPEHMLASKLHFRGIVVFPEIIDFNWKVPKKCKNIKVLLLDNIDSQDNTVRCEKTEPYDNGEHEYVEYFLVRR